MEREPSESDLYDRQVDVLPLIQKKKELLQIQDNLAKSKAGHMVNFKAAQLVSNKFESSHLSKPLVKQAAESLRKTRKWKLKEMMDLQADSEHSVQKFRSDI